MASSFFDPKANYSVGDSARNQQTQTQNLQNNAVSAIQAIFEGGTATPYLGAQYTKGGAVDPNATYYVNTPSQGFLQVQGIAAKPSTDGGVWDPGVPAKTVAGILDKYDPKSSGNTSDPIYTGTQQTYTGYGALPGQRQQDYLNWATPQYQQQLLSAQKSMLGNLADRGLLGSSANQTLADTLSAQANAQYQNIGNTGVSLANSLQNQISQQEASLIAEAQSATNPAANITSALNTAGSFSAPTQYSPIGSLFSQFTSSLTPAATAAASGSYLPTMYNNPYTTSTGYLPSNG
jgi:hypothetical protein